MRRTPDTAHCFEQLARLIPKFYTAKSIREARRRLRGIQRLTNVVLKDDKVLPGVKERTQAQYDRCVEKLALWQMLSKP